MDKESKRLYDIQYRAKNMEKLLKQHKQRRKDNPEYMKNYRLMHLYGITLSEWKEMLKKQDNCCAICRTNMDLFKREFHTDHCHETGKVRGLLCSNCNVGIGMFKNSENILLKAIEYLKSSSKS